MVSRELLYVFPQAAAAAQSGSQQSSPSTSIVQQEPPTAGVAQMVVDPETGELVIDPNSLTMQAQAPVQFVRREDNDDVLINSMSHMKREATTRWSPEETEEWYLVSSIVSVWLFSECCFCTPVDNLTASTLHQFAVCCRMKPGVASTLTSAY